MRKIYGSILATSILLSFSLSAHANTQDLISVFQTALKNDPTFQAEVAQIQSTKEGVPIARSYLLPQFNTDLNGSRNYLDNRTGTTITAPAAQGTPLANTTYGVGHYDYNYGDYELTLSQSVFDYSLWAGLSAAKYFSKAADANYTAALQDLIFRTTTAYFDVLSAEDNLRYVEAEKKAVYQQLDQAQQQYKVGVIPITNVYQAQAEYDSLLSQEIQAQNNIINQRENLRTITNVYYNDLAELKSNLPLISPIPDDPSAWVKSAIDQNWKLKAQSFNSAGFHEEVNQQRAGHLPVVEAYASNVGTKQQAGPSGKIDSTQNVVGLELSFPVFQGGLVTSKTEQASYNYQNALANQEKTYRQVVDDTRTSFNDIVSGVNQIKADKQAILSNASSLDSTIEGYKVGTQTMLDVLQAQQNLYQAEQQFSNDEYAYLNATVALKAAAGTLSLNDVLTINTWLTKMKKNNYSSLDIATIEKQAKANYQATLRANKAIGIDVNQNDVVNIAQQVESKSSNLNNNTQSKQTSSNHSSG